MPADQPMHRLDFTRGTVEEIPPPPVPLAAPYGTRYVDECGNPVTRVAANRQRGDTDAIEYIKVIDGRPVDPSQLSACIDDAVMTGDGYVDKNGHRIAPHAVKLKTNRGDDSNV